MTDGSALSNATLRASLARSAALRPARAVAVITQIAAALDAADDAHAIRHDVVHPANIILAADDVAYLADTGPDAPSNAGTSIEGLAYLAPERLTRNAPISAATDVYALACVLYECLTGQPPYPAADDLSALVAAHTGAPIPQPSQALPSIPAGFDEVIARGLAKDPADRYLSAGQLAAAANQALGSPAGPAAEPAPPTVEYPVTVSEPWLEPPQLPDRAPAAVPAIPMATRRRRRTAIALALAVVCLLIATTLVFVGTRPLRHTTAPAIATSSPPTPPSRLVELPFRELGEPTGLAVDASGHVYLAMKGSADLEGGYHSPVLKLTVKTGKVTELPLPIGYRSSASGVAVDAAGNVYVASSPALFRMPVGASEPSQVLRTRGSIAGVAVDASGNVYVAEAAFGAGSRNQVLKLAPGAADPSVLPFPALDMPGGIAVDPTGNVYVVTSHVLKLPPGAQRPIVLPGLLAPDDIAVDSTGNLYIASAGACAVFKISPPSTEPTMLLGDGRGHLSPDTKPGCPTSIAVDPSGNLYLGVWNPGPTNTNPYNRVIMFRA